MSIFLISHGPFLAAGEVTSLHQGTAAGLALLACRRAPFWGTNKATGGLIFHG